MNKQKISYYTKEGTEFPVGCCRSDETNTEKTRIKIAEENGVSAKDLEKLKKHPLIKEMLGC